MPGSFSVFLDTRGGGVVEVGGLVGQRSLPWFPCAVCPHLVNLQQEGGAARFIFLSKGGLKDEEREGGLNRQAGS